MSTSTKEIIGYLNLTAATTYTRHYETASWRTDIEVPAGEYPITMNKDGKQVTALLPGKVVGSFFQSSGFGHYCEPKIDKDIGKKDTFALVLYRYVFSVFCSPKYDADGVIRHGSSEKYRLADGYHLTSRKWTRYDGSEETAYNFEKTENA